MSASQQSPDNSQPTEVMLRAVVMKTGAIAAACWHVTALPDELRLVAQAGFGAQQIDVAQKQWTGHEQLLRDVAAGKESRTVDAQLSLEGSTRTLRLHFVPTDDVLFELFFDGGTSIDDAVIAKATQDCVQSATKEVSSDAHRTMQALIRLYGHTDSTNFEKQLVEEIRSWAGCDRVTLVRYSGRRAEIRAISGIATFDERGPMVTAMCELVQSLQTEGHQGVLTLQQNPQKLTSYAEQNSAQDVEYWPLAGANCAVILETFGDTAAPSSSPGDRQLLISGIGECLVKANSFSVLKKHPLLRWLAPLGSLFHWKRLAVVALLAAIVATLCIVETDLVLVVPATLTPEETWQIHSPMPAVVETIHVTHGQHIEADEPLIDLHNDQLERLRQELNGELGTVKQKIVDLETLRSDPTRSRNLGGEALQQADLAASEKELGTQQESLESQIELVDKQIESLHIVSPISGTVLTWQVDTLLRGQPVQPSQPLLNVADLDDPWELELRIPMSDLGAFRRVANPKVAFLHPNGTEVVLVKNMEVSEELLFDAKEGAVLPVGFRVPRDQIPPATKPGTQTVARIECGKAAVGYVWFRRGIDQLTQWWRLRFG
ncbi:MAG: efflux RND transporter periplasmic adaptor subunit [Planctomycetaceae bacterium]|nr:efflux RND transporter periplasmic adaptor subunit [Planctomycetaceae bacterium]